MRQRVNGFRTVAGGSGARPLHVPDLDVVALELWLGLEYLEPRAVAKRPRSCRRPSGRTAEFRNPHYHRPTDTPDTLDCDFMASTAALLVLAVASGRPSSPKRSPSHC